MTVNPGGPGQSGVLLPADISLGTSAELARRFDLIGFDTRGVGDSSPRLPCPEVLVQFFPDRESNRTVAQEIAAQNKTCADSDPALTASMTSENIARDMDRIRAALGEQKISYFGISWGTDLGATYQSLYPQRVKRMVLDSVVDTETRFDRADDDVTAAAERNARRFIAWIAQFRPGLGLGRTPAEVRVTHDRLKEFYTANPQESIPGLDEFVDEFTVAFKITATSPNWPSVAEDLVTMKKFADSAGLRAASTPGDRSKRVKLPVEFFNGGVNSAVQCNADAGIRDFDAWFDRFDQRRKKFPLAGNAAFPVPFCIGWPHPVRQQKFTRTGAAILTVGHEFEIITPGVWQRDMRARIGGDSLVVEDDVHASLIDVPCASKAVDFLVNGRKASGRCAGIPLP